MLVSATATSPQLHEQVFAAGSPHMVRALACNPEISEELRLRIYQYGDPVARRRAVALTRSHDMLEDALATQDPGIQEAAAANPWLDLEALSQAAGRGNPRALLSPRSPQDARVSYWSAERAQRFALAGRKSRMPRSPALEAARCLAIAFAAPWLSAAPWRGALRIAFENYAAIKQMGLLEATSSELTTAMQSPTHGEFARVALAVSDPTSTSLRDSYSATLQGWQGRRPEAYSLGLSISAYGAQVHNYYATRLRSQNPTEFISPVCQLNTWWGQDTPVAVKGYEELLAFPTPTRDIVAALEGEWEGSLGSLLAAGVELAK